MFALLFPVIKGIHRAWLENRGWISLSGHHRAVGASLARARGLRVRAFKAWTRCG